MKDIELLEEVVKELEIAQEEERADMEDFRLRYDLLVDCAIDELNDEILKNKINSVKATGPLTLLKDGTQQVYVGEQIATRLLVGGEEFSIKRVERGKDKSSLVNFLLEPLFSANFDYLILPYSRAINEMSKQFSVIIAKYLLPAMSSIEKEVVDLQREFEDRHRQREIKLLGSGSAVYKETAWN